MKFVNKIAAAALSNAEDIRQFVQFVFILMGDNHGRLFAADIFIFDCRA